MKTNLMWEISQEPMAKLHPGPYPSRSFTTPASGADPHTGVPDPSHAADMGSLRLGKGSGETSSRGVEVGPRKGGQAGAEKSRRGSPTHHPSSARRLSPPPEGKDTLAAENIDTYCSSSTNERQT